MKEFIIEENEAGQRFDNIWPSFSDKHLKVFFTKCSAKRTSL